MSKQVVQYVCQTCGVTYAKWQGRCNSCNSWNTIIEEVVIRYSKNKKDALVEVAPILLKEVTINDSERIVFDGLELNRVLGGGLVKGSLVLVAGEPGVGKSTLMLQIALAFRLGKVLYVSGEESAEQIGLRAERMGLIGDNCYVFCETNIESVLEHVQNLKPSLIIIDSVQTIYSDAIEALPGTVTQIRESTFRLQDYAKRNRVPIFLVGHITKDGFIAGPKLLEHIVDTVLYFEGESHFGLRILRSTKNRFGSTLEFGVFEMTSAGLKEVVDTSRLFINEHEQPIPGIAVGCIIEGLRPILIEVQALVTATTYSQPQRSATGFDLKRLAMILAVLEKKLKLRLSNRDIFLNITGGLRVSDTALDLAVVVAIMSSFLDIPVKQTICFSAEVGLSGEVRPINRMEQRLNEIEKRSYDAVYISKYNLTDELKALKYRNLKIVPASNIQTVFGLLFGKKTSE